jgi:hypothetical protein
MATRGSGGSGRQFAGKKASVRVEPDSFRGQPNGRKKTTTVGSAGRGGGLAGARAQGTGRVTKKKK